MAFPKIGVRDLSTFLEGLRNAGRTAFSSTIKVSDVHGGLSCYIQIEEGGSDGAGSAPFNEHYDTPAEVLQVMRTLIECTCPVWKYAEVFFSNSSLGSSEYSTLVGDMLPLLRSSPSLSTIRLGGNSDGLNLPSLVCDNPVLETLILSDSFYYTSEGLKYAQDLADCFSRNSVLKSCSIGAYFSTAEVWEVALKPLMPRQRWGRANVALKELVLKGVVALSAVEAMANLVRGNTTLEKLELGMLGCPTQGIPLVPQALTVNRTLNEFRWRCGLAGLKELAGAFTLDSSGRQGNTHVTTLKLFPDGKLSEFMDELCRLLERNTTVKQVEVDSGTGSWEVKSLKSPRYGSKECVQDVVESIVIGKKLRVNTSLESVVVGSWKLVRVDGHGEWQMKYCGPCLLRRSPLAGETQYHVENDESFCYVSSRYVVKVKIRR